MTRDNRPLRVLWLTTKHPWPPHDGGRLLVTETLAALDPEACAVTIAGPWPGQGNADSSEQDRALCEHAPAINACLGLGTLPRLSPWARALGALAIGAPINQRRYIAPLLGRRLVEAVRATEPPDVIHLEQPHAAGLLPPAGGRGAESLLQCPRLLRAQNVEFDLWRRFAGSAGGAQARLLQRQAEAVRRFESACIARCDLVVAISEDDRQSLESTYAAALRVADSCTIWLPPAIPKAAPSASPALAGSPALIMPCGSSWAPNRIGEIEFVRDAWPTIASSVPDAHLHLFTADRAYGQRLQQHAPASITLHAYPEQSADLFAPNATLVVPVLCTSGVRMKILESWSRSVPVITSEPGARGLSHGGRQAVEIAGTADSLPTPVDWRDTVRSSNDPQRRLDLVARGLKVLDEEHAPARVARRYLEACEALLENRVGNAC